MTLYQILEPTDITHIAEGDIIVGIDLGTTNSIIAYYNGNETIVVPLNDNGDTLLPSVVSYRDNTSLVGHSALTQPSYIKSVKRLMGKGINDGILVNNIWDIDHKNSSNEIVKLSCNGKDNISPIEAAAEILKSLKKSAENYIGRQIKKIVITVPAHFDEAARTATKDAARIAGLEVVRMINEPTAAAIAYGLDVNPTGNFLVYDLGGGTFDVSILKMYGGILRVIATGGDGYIGGDDFDMMLLRMICKRIGYNPAAATAKHVLLATQIKNHLSTQYTWIGNFLGSETSITRSDAEKAWHPLIEKTMQIARDTVDSAKVQNISHVVLVGGATRIPAIQNAIKNAFNSTLLMHIDPDKVVAVGAALQARALMTSDHLLIDVVPLSLGIELLGNMVEVIIQRNTPIPAVAYQTYTTYVDNQRGFKIHILQGEGESVDSCRSLGTFELNGITPKPAGAVRLEVCFRVDADGLLTVSARDMESNKTCSVEVKPSYGLTEEEIRQLLSGCITGIINL